METVEAATGRSRIALAAAILVATGSSVGGHLRFLIGVPLTVGGFVVAWLATRHTARVNSAHPPDALILTLSAMAAVGLLTPSPRGTFWYEIVYRAHPAVALITLGIYAGGDAIWRRRAVWTTVATATIVQVLAPIGVPDPNMDVWNWIQTCAAALLHAVHPYTVHAIDTYHGAWDFGSTPSVFPYMPLTLIALAPAVAIAGDYRFALALSLPATIALARAGGRRLGAAPALIDIVTFVIALHPRGTLLVVLGYPEPLLILALALFVWLAARGAETGRTIAFFLLPALKQYVVAPVALLVVMPTRPRAILAGAAAAAATVVPFLIWSWRPTLAGMFYLMRAPIGFRVDSDSLAALGAQIADLHMARWVAVATQFIVAGLLVPFVRRERLGGVLLASALSLIASFLVATQAFFNYYAVAAAMLAFAGLFFAATTPVDAAVRGASL